MKKRSSFINANDYSIETMTFVRNLYSIDPLHLTENLKFSVGWKNSLSVSREKTR